MVITLSPDAERALAGRLRRHVEALAARIGPRHMGRPGSLAAAAAYVRQQLEAWGDVVERQAYAVDGEPVENLVVERRGTAEPGRIVILGAHYDTVAATPGADDNASAVAALLEVAGLLAGTGAQRTIRLAAFANEEPPHFHTQTMGSQVYARRCRQKNERLVGLICLEMIGYYDPSPGCQSYPALIAGPARLLLPGRGHFVAAVANLRSVRLLWRFRQGFRRSVRFPLIAVALPQLVREIRFSDHGPFWDEGFPALMVTDTAFYRNPHYHRPGDTAETLDYASLARVTIGVAGAVAHIAGAAPRADGR